MDIISLEKYLEYWGDPDLYSQHIDDIKDYNKALLHKYPWLVDREYDEALDTYLDHSDDEQFTTTWLDSMEDGWRIAFGDKMCEELQKELERVNFVDKYVITDVKEKWGGLRWYTGAIPADSDLIDIVDKYERMSKRICCSCGKPATVLSKGYILPFCNECKKKHSEKDKYLQFVSKEGIKNEDN